MKRICAAFLLIVISSVCFPAANTKAYDIYDEITQYLLADKGQMAILKELQESVSEMESIYSGKTGKIEISKPFKIPLYNVPTESLYDLNNELYSICYCNDKAIGILGFLYSDKDITPLYYMLPDDFSCNNFSLCFYDYLFDKNGESLYGSSIIRVIIAVNNENSDIIFFGENNSWLRNDKQLKTLIDENKLSYKYTELANYNFCNEKLQIICTLNMKMNSDVQSKPLFCKIINSSNGKALTYADGKLTVQDVNNDNPDSQVFTIKKTDDGYLISPQNDIRKKISIDKNYYIGLAFSYHGELTCKLSGKSGSVLKLKDNKAVCGKYDFWDSSCDWIITCLV